MAGPFRIYDKLVTLLPPAARAALSLFGMLLILPLMGLIAWHGWHLALGSWEREPGAAGPSYGLVTLALPISAVMISVSIIRRMFTTELTHVFEPDRPADPLQSTEDIL